MKTISTILVAAGLAASPVFAQSADSAKPGGDVSAQGKGKGTVIAGAINANGTAQLSPTTFTVTHPSTGRYVITFKTAFAKDAICVYLPVGSAVRVNGLGVSKTTCDVTFVSTSSGAAADTLFTFLAANAG